MENGLAVAAGVLLSLVFRYVPGARDWFGKLGAEQKRLVMLGLLAIVALAVAGLACTGLADDFGVAATCDQSGLVRLAQAFIAALVANQSVFLISPTYPRPNLPLAPPMSTSVPDGNEEDGR